ncbi:uncharacterized protein LOC132907937, partial [Bombus pascuorum]|uniref:uncharacterized protein LOC132907937 n=1 Tax=Bombus pascuorum TaxID=65598 RepID=UPI00298E4616
TTFRVPSTCYQDFVTRDVGLFRSFLFIVLEVYHAEDNVYQPSRCEYVIEELRQCCIKHSAISLVCDGIDTSKPYEHNTVDYRKAQK